MQLLSWRCVTLPPWLFLHSTVCLVSMFCMTAMRGEAHPTSRVATSSVMVFM